MVSTTVADYYAGKSIFITGATGFLGKILVEKLLRCCPDVKKIYVLMRPKKGQDVRERLQTCLSSRVFEKVRTECPENLNKLHIVPGDILKENLGISAEDRKELVQECQIIFNGAASVRFDMPLRQAVHVNVEGIKKVLDLAKEMNKLEAFLHISTAFSFCEIEVLEEKVYRTKHRPQDLIECASWMSDELMETIKPELTAPQPNTYGYTKGLAEDLVSQYAGKFPIAIARPSIVIAAYKEPICGYIDNANGPTGIIIAVGKGVLRTMLCDPDIRAELVPVDIVINACIILTYLTGIHKPKEIQVCNISDSSSNSLTWGRGGNLFVENYKNVPFSQCLWLPYCTANGSLLKHKISLLLTQLLPAYIVDLLMIIMQKKPFMLKVQQKIANGMRVLEDYTLKEWLFKNDNFVSLKNKISKKDNEIFYTDTQEIDWVKFVPHYIMGAREFVCKEDPATLPKARRLYMRLYYIDMVAKVLLCVACAYFVFYLYNWIMYL